MYYRYDVSNQIYKQPLNSTEKEIFVDVDYSAIFSGEKYVVSGMIIPKNTIDLDISLGDVVKTKVLHIETDYNLTSNPLYLKFNGSDNQLKITTHFDIGGEIESIKISNFSTEKDSVIKIIALGY